MHRTFLLVLSIAAALAVGACTPSLASQSPTSTAATGSTSSGGPAATGDMSATIHVMDFKLDSASISVAGTVLSLAVTNDGPTIHNVTVRDGSGAVLFGSKDLREGESETITHAIAPGSYTVFCSLPGHESLGVKGTLAVTGP